MGLMRRVESRLEKAAGTEDRTDQPAAPKRSRAKKGELLVQPEEVARKLVKELEDNKVAVPDGLLVPHRYVVYLCPSDHKRLSEREEKVLGALERHLTKHVRAKKYRLEGEIAVIMMMEADLSPGYFGILADRPVEPPLPEPRPRSVSRPRVDTRRSKVSSRVIPQTAGRGAAATATGSALGSTQIIGAGEAARLDLAHQTIVLHAGNRIEEFDHGRVIVGRAKDVDFRIDDPNVSRRHAAIYWADGAVVVKDLDSTNGTLVNGYPVRDTVLKPGDVIVIGDCRITVETR